MQDNNKPEIAKKVGLMSIEEAAKYTGFSEGKFRQEISPKLNGVELGNKKYFTEKELIDWLQARITNIPQIASL